LTKKSQQKKNFEKKIKNNIGLIFGS